MANNENNAKASSLTPALLIGVLGSLLITAALGAALLLGVMKQTATDRLQAYAQAQAERQAAVVEQVLSAFQTQLDRLGRHPDTIQAVTASGDAIATRKAMLTALFPHAVAVRVMPLDETGTAALDATSLDLKVIELDLLRKAANRSEDRAPDVYRKNGEWVTSLAAPIGPENGDAVGGLLVTFELSRIRSLLDTLAPAAGRTDFYTEFRTGNPVNIIENGATGPITGDATLFQAWHLRFAPADSVRREFLRVPLLGWIMLGIGTLLVGVLAFVGQRGVLGHVNHELRRLQAYLAEGAYGEPPTFGLTALNTVAQTASDAVTQAHKAAETAAPAAAKPKAAPSASAPAETAQDSAAPAAADEETAPEEAAETEAEEALGDPLFQSMDIEDLDSLEDLEDSLLVEDNEEEGFLDASFQEETSGEAEPLADAIFRAYDIRGVASTQLSADTVHQIGLGIGSEARDQGQSTVVVGRDGRHSSPDMRDHLIRGLTEAGCDVVDIGLVPSPVLYFATHHLETGTGVMITGSHNPAEYNGMKIVINGHTLSGDDLQALKTRIQDKRFTEGQGTTREEDVKQAYVDRISSDVAIAQPLKVVVDCGNGAAGEIAPLLLRELGCEVVPLYCDIDGSFPNHHPDPSVLANLRDLQDAVAQNGADLGLAFDGDGDRIGVVTASQQVVMPDRLLMLFAQDIVARNPGADIIFDIKCTRHLNAVISNYGGRPIMWRSGHSHIKEKMIETGALLGGELSGHIFFKERWFGFDDGLYSAARLIEILSTSSSDLDTQLAEFPESVSTPEIKIDVPEEQKFSLVEQLAQADFDGGKLTTIDGVRVDFDDGWGLVRASNTTPCLTLRFEADDDAALERIQALFRTQLQSIDNALTF